MDYKSFVFRHRFWIFAAVYWLGFALYSVDRENVSLWMVQRIMPGATDDAVLRALRIILAFGAGLVTLCALVRTWATAYLDTSVVHDTKLHSESLVASGPYRYVRNPLYLGGFLLSLGFALMASRLGFVVIVAGITALQLMLIFHEEHELALTHGGSFAAYRAKVPRLVPALTPRVPDAGTPARWGQALLGEAFMWIFAFAATAGAVTLNTKWVAGTALFGVMFHIVVIGGVRRARARRRA